MSQKLILVDVFKKDMITEIRTMCQYIEPARWSHRTVLGFPRAVGNSDCRYDFCGHNQMPVDLKEKLINHAPKFEGFNLNEVAINRYNIGDYIGKHKDRDLYRLNLVIALQENGDGLLIDDTGEFIEDKAGQGVLIEGVGPVHSVPPVKNTRYSLVYLYE